MAADGDQVVIRDGLTKTIKRQGSGERTPAPNDLCHCHYVGTLEDGSPAAAYSLGDHCICGSYVNSLLEQPSSLLRRHNV